MRSECAGSAQNGFIFHFVELSIAVLFLSRIFALADLLYIELDMGPFVFF